MGREWNARAVHDAVTITGKYGIEVQCANGERFFRFADQHEFFVINTCFRYQRRYLGHVEFSG